MQKDLEKLDQKFKKFASINEIKDLRKDLFDTATKEELRIV